MSIGAGSLSLTRLQVLEKPGKPDFRAILKGLREQAIVPIGMEDTTEESAGWCHPHTGEPDLTDARDWLSGEAFLFGMRLDQKKVPGTLYRLQLRQLLHELEQTSPRGGEGAEGGGGASRKRKERAKERVKFELLKRTLPSIRLVELVWHLDTNEIWIASTASAVFETFDALFLKSFGLPYVFKTPGTMGIEFDRLLLGLDSSDKRMEALTQAVPWGAFGRTSRSGATSMPSPVHSPEMEERSDAPF